MTSLEQMLSYELDRDLRKVAGEGSLENIVFQLIKIADCDGWIDRLICGAYTSNPNNERLRAIKEELLPNLNQQTFHASKTDNSTQKTNQYPFGESNQEELKIFHQSSRFRHHDQALEAEKYEQNFRQLLRDGHPTNDTRHEELKQSSRLSEEELKRIEHRVNEEYELEEKKYEQALSRVVWGFIILELFVSPRLRSVPPCSKLCDSDLKRIYSRLKRDARRRATKRFILSAKILSLIAVIILIIHFGHYLFSLSTNDPGNPSISTPQSVPASQVDVSKKISYGRISLFPPNFFQAGMREQRKPGIDSFNKAQTAEQYEEVVRLFNEYLEAENKEKKKINRNDAEALIFKNNAMALAKEKDNPPLTIGVSVPISTSPNVAMEILRGVAQAQYEVNKSNQARLLQVIIGDDENDEKMAENIAHKFVDKGVLAVIGSNNTDASMGAARVYNNEKNKNIFMISPTAFGEGFGNFTNAKQMVQLAHVNKVAEVLTQEINSLKTSPTTKINLLICSDRNSQDNNKFIDEFRHTSPQSFQINEQYKCNLDDEKLNIGKIVESAVHDNDTNAILLAPHINEDKFQKAIEVAMEAAKINNPLPQNGHLKLFGSPTMNAAYIGKQGEEAHRAFNGMKVAVPWNPGQGEGEKFLNSANCLWGGDVNWRTAMAFDATNVIINNLRANLNKIDINKIKITDSDFDGATGKVSFAGNRAIEASIVVFEDKGKNSGFQPRGKVNECKSGSN
ncbi:MAG: hypothetical protein HC815_34305 [Richelia sp. RM1_1_1]|nr:hypothetical protein [Richelia sp. RM1_1_1]